MRKTLTVRENLTAALFLLPMTLLGMGGMTLLDRVENPLTRVLVFMGMVTVLALLPLGWLLVSTLRREPSFVVTSGYPLSPELAALHAEMTRKFRP